MHITLNKEQKLSVYTLYENKNHFYIQTNPKVLPYKKVLYISRSTGKVAQLSQKDFFDSLKKQRHDILNFSLILGKIVIEQQPYLIFCEQAKKVTFQKFSSIYQIKSIFIKKFNLKTSVSDEKNQSYLNYLQNYFFKDNFYFSYSTDLTISYKRKRIGKSNSSEYFWNQDMVTNFSQIGLSSPWIIPIIQGHVQCITFKDMEYRSISRRSKFMSGTRFNSRGLDENSNASNFVQTQQIIYFQNLILSHIQLRGSCPIFWNQQSQFSGIIYKKDQHKNYMGLKNHYQSLSKQYNCSINSINLLSQEKTTQAQLSTKFQYFFNKSQKKVNYFLYDFNKNIKLNATLTEQENVTKFIQQYQKLIGQNNFDCLQINTQRLIQQQKYIARVNCLDCIDRTNVIMTRISQRFINRVLSLLDIKNTDSFIKEHLQIWSNLGNKISNIYCGTDSIADHLTKKQQASYFLNINSGWKSLNRFFNSTMNDQMKQKCTQIVLIKNQKSETKYFQDNIDHLILKTQDYCDYKQLSLTILTWNVGAIHPQKLSNQHKAQFLKSVFNPQNNLSDMIFITMQQIVELNSYNVIANSENSQVIQLWTKQFKQIINYGANGFHYKLYESKSLVGLAFFIFVKESLNPKLDIQSKIKYSQYLQIKRGFNGVLGNKGSLVSFIQFQDTYITIFCSHLAAGDQKINERTQDINKIFAKIQTQPYLQRFLKKSDFVFFTGDLNFRLSMSDADIRGIIYDHLKFNKSQKQLNYQGNNIKQLLTNDQFYKYHFNIEGNLFNFYEKTINFLPTYKFQKNSDNYDAKRPPAWCDRILSKELYEKTLNRGVYNSLQIKLSDHRPVMGEFRMLVKVQNKKRKNELINKYLGRQINIKQEQIYKFNQNRVFYKY